jgi:hypothetical protein
LPSADEPKPDSFTAIAEVGSRLLDKRQLHCRYQTVNSRAEALLMRAAMVGG